MVSTFKTRIYPTAEQCEYIHKACGLRRWTWNWAVATFFESAKQNKFPTAFDLQKKCNNEIIVLPENQWMKELNSMVRAEALKDFGLSIAAYAKARHEAKRTVEKCDIDKYKPTFKKKGKCTESFRYNNKGTPFKVKSAHHFTLTRIRRLTAVCLQDKRKYCLLTGQEVLQLHLQYEEWCLLLKCLVRENQSYASH